MQKLTTLIAGFALLVSAALSFAQAQAISTVGTLVEGKHVLDFYKTAINNPQQILILALNIEGLFSGGPDRYKGLSNEFAVKMKWFETGPLALEHIELSPEPLTTLPYGNYSITLKQLTEKECKALTNNSINLFFVRVELNGATISARGNQIKAGEPCKSEWFFQDGKNELKYVGPQFG